MQLPSRMQSPLVISLRILGACVTLIKKKIKFSSYILEIQNGAVAKSYMTNGLPIYGEIFLHFLIYKEALLHI
jgi:hypothetical protein